MKNSLKFTTYELFLALRFFVNMAQDLLCVMAVLVVNLHLCSIFIQIYQIAGAYQRPHLIPHRSS